MRSRSHEQTCFFSFQLIFGVNPALTAEKIFGCKTAQKICNRAIFFQELNKLFFVVFIVTARNVFQVSGFKKVFF
jgi:hypothetical protein